MKTSIIFLNLCFLFGQISISAFSQTIRSKIANNKEREIARIETYCKAVDNFIEQTEKSALIYANTSSTEKAKWQSFKTEKAREAADTGDNLNENAYVWRKNGKVVAANFTFQSPSRDWAHFIKHYYRADGSLAKVRANLNTFYGNATIERQFYFDGRGKLLHQTKRVLDLSTRKAKKLDEDFIDEEVYIFKKVSKLPFASVLEN